MEDCAGESPLPACAPHTDVDKIELTLELALNGSYPSEVNPAVADSFAAIFCVGDGCATCSSSRRLSMKQTIDAVHHFHGPSSGTSGRGLSASAASIHCDVRAAPGVALSTLDDRCVHITRGTVLTLMDKALAAEGHAATVESFTGTCKPVFAAHRVAKRESRETVPADSGTFTMPVVAGSSIALFALLCLCAAMKLRRRAKGAPSYAAEGDAAAPETRAASCAESPEAPAGRSPSTSLPGRPQHVSVTDSPCKDSPNGSEWEDLHDAKDASPQKIIRAEAPLGRTSLTAPHQDRDGARSEVEASKDAQVASAESAGQDFPDGSQWTDFPDSKDASPHKIPCVETSRRIFGRSSSRDGTGSGPHETAAASARRSASLQADDVGLLFTEDSEHDFCSV